MSRWFTQLSAVCVFGVSSVAWLLAESPEPMPSYANTHPLREDASLRAVAFGDTRIGIACGDRGTILRSEDGGESWLAHESGVDCRLDDVTWIDRQRVVIVGGGYDRITRISRGVVLYSDDAGAHWQRAADEELPRLRTVRVLESQSCVALGDWSPSLLTGEFESHDGGRSWVDGGRFQRRASAPRSPTSSELQAWASATGVAAVIRDACRIDEAGLCAVADHGVILLSRDSGKSWRVTRGVKRRASILFVANDAASVAWSLLGREAHESRNRVALLLHQASGRERDDEVPSIELASQIAVMLGGSGADAIGASDTTLARAAMEWMYIHRPAALVLDQSLPADVRDAFFQAATSSGILRVVGYSFDAKGHMVLHSDALLPKTGVLASDMFADAMHFLAPHRAGSSPSIASRYLYDAATSMRKGDSIASGLPLEQGQLLTAADQQASRRQLQIVQGRLRQSELIANLVHTSRTPDRFAESIGLALDQTAKEDQFRLAWSIWLESAAYDVTSRGAGYQEVALKQLAVRFPATSASRWAQLRLESIRQSLEWQRLRSSVGDATSKSAAAPAAEIVPVSPFQVSPGSVQQVSAVSPLLVPKPETLELTPAVDEEAEVDLAWEFHPLVLIAREAARRRGDDGQLRVASGDSPNLKRLAEADHGAWSGLLRSGGPQVVLARRAAAPPKLDGVLDDACWNSPSPSTTEPTPLRLAYDDDYVYVAAQCQRQDLDAPALAAPTSFTVRDHDLTDVGRMWLRIDTDRDLLTAMQLQVSESGRTHDAIDGNPRWQPTWYVDSRRSGDKVTFELAILRRDLADLPIPAGESWFLSARPLRAGSSVEETVMPTPGAWMRVDFQP